MTAIRHGWARLSALPVHYLEAGAGDPAVLLHGWPETSHSWRKVIARLAPQHRLVAPDLRGLGDSGRPPAGYDARTVATDVAELVGHLGLGRFHLVGHDWGGAVAFALATLVPQAVRTLSIVDVTAPGLGPDISQGGRRWHHPFHMTPDLPEALVTGRERIYLSWFYQTFCWRQDAISPADVDEYVRTYSQPGALRAGFAYYRAIPDNVAYNRGLRDSGFRLAMPVLAAGGARTEARGRASEPEASLREIATDVHGAVVAESGHFVPEEQPDALAALLLEHFARATS